MSSPTYGFLIVLNNDNRILGIVYVGQFFFFKQKTAYEIYQCDWSSDVCSSDLSVGPSRLTGAPATQSMPFS